MDVDAAAFWRIQRATTREEYKALEHTEVMQAYADVLYACAVGGDEGRRALRAVVEATDDGDERLSVIEHCRHWVVPVDEGSEFGGWLLGVAREIDGGQELLELMERHRRLDLRAQEEARLLRGRAGRRAARRARRRGQRP